MTDTHQQSMKAAAEDHALVSVPAEHRYSGYKLALSPISVATALVIFSIAGFTIMLAGFKAGLTGSIMVAILGFILGKLLGNMAFQTGMSSTITSRFFGFGLKGSSIGAAIFTFMILGFLALESALLYEGTLLMFNWVDNWPNRILLYGLMTIAWILLAIFGLKLALRASGLLTVVTLLVSMYMIIQLYVVGNANPMAVFTTPGLVPGSFVNKLEVAIAIMGATAGTISLVTADFARYCRTKKDVTILAIAGPLTQNFIMTILGALIVIGGLPEIIQYLMHRDAGLSPEEAAVAAGGFVMGNTGAFFVVLASWIGFITIYAAQGKAQAINAYSGSLSLVNLCDALLGKKPGRAFMVIVGNIIALVMIAANILGEFTAWLSFLGCMTLGLCGVMISDYYIVRKGIFDSRTHQIENWNWAGVMTLIVCASIGIILIGTKVFSLGFLVTVVV